MCKSWCESIVAIVILVFSLIPALWSLSWSRWVIAVAALLLLIHSFTCKSCFNKNMATSPKSKRK